MLVLLVGVGAEGVADVGCDAERVHQLEGAEGGGGPGEGPVGAGAMEDPGAAAGYAGRYERLQRQCRKWLCAHSGNSSSSCHQFSSCSSSV